LKKIKIKEPLALGIRKKIKINELLDQGIRKIKEHSLVNI
jgi:hypothetical protein